MSRWNVHFDMTVAAGERKVVESVAKIHALASVIRGIPIPPHIQARLDKLNIVRAVRGTTGIEGTELSEEQVGEILSASKEQRVLPVGREREEQEVRNADDLMEFVAQELGRNSASPLSEDLVRTFHEILTRKIDYPHNTPGLYRSYPVQAGSYLSPKTGEEVQRLMTGFIDWFNSGVATSWDPVIRAIVAHFFVISIHPFGDGNGRASRAVESYLLYQAGVNARGYYSLANYYYRNRPEYVPMLDHVRFRSGPDLTPFVTFALKGLVEELEAVHDEVLQEVRIVSFRDFARETLSSHGRLGTPIGERQLLFLFALGEESVSLRQLRAGRHGLSRLYKGVTTRTLTRDIDFLRQQKLVVIDGDQLKANLGITTQFTAMDSP